MYMYMKINLTCTRTCTNTGWGGESWTKTFFFQYIGPHVILKLILGLKSTVLYGLDPWLTTIQYFTSFFLATAEWRRRKERYVLRILTATFRSYSAATDGRRAAKLAWGVAWPFGCFVWAGPLANHHSIFHFIFLSNGWMAAAERAVCFADLNRPFPLLFRGNGRT